MTLGSSQLKEYDDKKKRGGAGVGRNDGAPGVTRWQG